MKRLISIAVLTVIIATMFAACSKFTCDICGEKKSGKKYTDEILGEKVTYCKDCHDGLEALGNAAASLDF